MFPGGCLLPGGVPAPGGACFRGVPAPRGVSIPACTEAESAPLPGEMATAVSGTHPTGMHSCWNYEIC